MEGGRWRAEQEKTRRSRDWLDIDEKPDRGSRWAA
jgi:hypothetical protein